MFCSAQTDDEVDAVGPTTELRMALERAVLEKEKAEKQVRELEQEVHVLGARLGSLSMQRMENDEGKVCMEVKQFQVALEESDCMIKMMMNENEIFRKELAQAKYVPDP